MVCKVLGDDVSLAIIKSTMNQSKSVNEISKARRMPVSSVYKKIKKLCDLGIVHIDRIDLNDKNGRKVTFYKSKIKELQLSLTKDGDTKLLVETFTSQRENDEFKSRSNLFLPANIRQ